jgi:hypothetical protein
MWHECNAAPWRYCNCSYLVKTLGELKRGIDHPCFGITRGRLITTFGPMATMLCGFIFEGLTYAPIRNLIAVVWGLRSNRNQLSTLVPPIIWMEWHCAFAQSHTTECQHKTNMMPCLGSIATVEMDRYKNEKWIYASLHSLPACMLLKLLWQVLWRLSNRRDVPTLNFSIVRVAQSLLPSWQYE